MPVASVRGIDIHYEILGERGPFVALQPGGRRAGASLRPLAAKIAEAGHRVLIYDRRNCGASGIAISVLSMALAAFAIGRLIHRATGSLTGGLVATALLMLNPDVLYLQSTPMTEPVLFGTTFLAVTLIAE